MSLIGRIVALAFFAVVLNTGSTSLKAGDCEYECNTVQGIPPFFIIECYDMLCVFQDDCDSNCTVLWCQDYEAGAQLELDCTPG